MARLQKLWNKEAHSDDALALYPWSGSDTWWCLKQWRSVPLYQKFASGFTLLCDVPDVSFYYPAGTG